MNKKFYKILILLLIVSAYFASSGSDCNNQTTQVTNNNIQGLWQLVSGTGGNLHDICPGEQVNFQSNGVAVLACPNQSPINQNYTVTNSVLKFTETQVEYSLNLTNNNNTLNMNGMGNISGRVLVYDKVSSYDKKSAQINAPNYKKNASEN